MPQHADAPPETDILCEHCGYGLNGLPTGGLCPECGQPIADSTVADGRVLPAWESSGPAMARFVRTARAVILSPADFFRQLQTRAAIDGSQSFAFRARILAAVPLGLTAVLHADAMRQLSFDSRHNEFLTVMVLAPFLILLTFLVLTGVTRLASYLSSLEGKYWGYRLPKPAVRRVLNYHAAQILPVAAVAFITVGAYRLLRGLGVFSGLADIKYLVVLCIEVLLGAGYLFRTYWIAMKNIMYANR